MMMFFTGPSRIASTVAGAKIATLEERRQVMTMTHMVDEALGILNSSNRLLTALGELLHERWMLKRELTDKLASAVVDEIYEAARAASAVGGKLLGAGGGGFMVFFVPPPAVRERLSKLIHVSFQIDTAGSRIMLYEPTRFERTPHKITILIAATCRNAAE